MKVLIADTFDENVLKTISELAGVRVFYEPNLNLINLKIAIKEKKPDVLIVKQTKVTAESIEASDSLRLVIQYGEDLKVVDTEICSQKGIFVATCKGKSIHAVAELTIGLIIAVNRRILDGVQLLKDGWWMKEAFSKCTGLKGQTLGLIGFGKIAQLVCKAAKSFEMNVLVHTRTKHDGYEKQFGFRYVELEELLADSHIVSLHVPLTNQTNEMVNNKFLALCRADVLIVNTAHADLIKENDLSHNMDIKKEMWYAAD